MYPCFVFKYASIALKSTFFCHIQGVKYEEQATPYAHVLTYTKINAKWALKSEPNNI
jgi:hypothetical protein